MKDFYAFPFTGNTIEQGLTKRELFAAMAMLGCLGHPDDFDSLEQLAKDAVTVADALLKALGPDEGEG